VAEANWDACLAFVLAAEGGYVDDPMDPGGATNMGITLQVLSTWRHTAVTKADVQSLGRDEAEAIYRANYWNAERCSDLPAGVDLMVFDAAVNIGIGRSAKFLQSVVGVTTDGSIGPQTITATAAKAPVDVVNGLAAARLQFYQGLPTFDHFGHGWTARMNNLKAQALQMVG
jgi:lysozyme family protein